MCDTNPEIRLARSQQVEMRMSPNQSPEAWGQMKKLGNGDFEKAVELEKAVRLQDSDLYFHKLGLPLQVAVDQSEMQLELFEGCDSGYCFT